MHRRSRSSKPWRLWAALTMITCALSPLSFAIEPPEESGPGEGAGVSEFSSPVLGVAPTLEIYKTGAEESYGLFDLRSFFTAYSDQWEVRWDVRSDRPHLIQGAGVPLLPGRGNQLTRESLNLPPGKEVLLDDVAALLSDFMAGTPELLRVSGLELRLDRERSLNFGDDGYLWFVELGQYHEGVPVRDAYVFFRINHGNIVQFGTHRVAEIDLVTEPAVSPEEASALASDALGVRLAAPLPASLEIYPVMDVGERVGEPYLGSPGLGYRHRLVWEVHHDLADDQSYRVVVDAHTGELLEVVNLTAFLGVAGEEKAKVSGDVYPVTNTDPLLHVGLPFTTVTDDGEIKVTDAAGYYGYSGNNHTATAELDGRYVRISDRCGAVSLSDSTDGNLDFGGSGGTDCATPGVGGSGNTHSARTGFYHLTNINRKAAGFFPGHPWLESTLTANMNIPQRCNAFWSPGTGTVNFYQSSVDCSNTGEIAAVFLHEWGHGMDQNTGGAAIEQGSGEAVGDTFAFLETGDACIGENFRPGLPCTNCRSSCTGVRDIAAFATGGISTVARPDKVEDDKGINCDRSFSNCASCPCGYRGPMGYEGHCESYIASTANWDLAGLVGTAVLESLWYGSLVPSKSAYRVASGGTCNPEANVDGCGAQNWYTVYLPIDDDDGNLANGTPNACKIWDAFNAHGIACGDRPPCSTQVEPPTCTRPDGNYPDYQVGDTATLQCTTDPVQADATVYRWRFKDGQPDGDQPTPIGVTDAQGVFINTVVLPASAAGEYTGEQFAVGDPSNPRSMPALAYTVSPAPAAPSCTRPDGSFPDYQVGDTAILRCTTDPVQAGATVYRWRFKDGQPDGDQPTPIGATDAQGVFVNTVVLPASAVGEYTGERFAVGDPGGPRSSPPMAYVVSPAPAAPTCTRPDGNFPDYQVGDTAILRCTTDPVQAGATVYRWRFKDGQPDGDQPTPIGVTDAQGVFLNTVVLPASAVGEYTGERFAVGDPGGPRSSPAMAYTVSPAPVAPTCTRPDGNFPDYHVGDTATLRCTTSPVQADATVYRWRFKDGQPDGDQPTPIGVTDAQGIFVNTVVLPAGAIGSYTGEQFAVGDPDGPRSSPAMSYTVSP